MRCRLRQSRNFPGDITVAGDSRASPWRPAPGWRRASRSISGAPGRLVSSTPPLDSLRPSGVIAAHLHLRLVAGAVLVGLGFDVVSGPCGKVCANTAVVTAMTLAVFSRRSRSPINHAPLWAPAEGLRGGTRMGGAGLIVTSSALFLWCGLYVFLHQVLFGRSALTPQYLHQTLMRWGV